MQLSTALACTRSRARNHVKSIHVGITRIKWYSDGVTGREATAIRDESPCICTAMYTELASGSCIENASGIFFF